MAGMLRRLYEAARGEAHGAGATPGQAVRRFEAAVVDRLTASWTATNVAIDQELRGDLDRMRARSRDLFKNNEYAKKFGRMVRANVVGPEGFSLQARAEDSPGRLDTVANRAIERAFWRWCRPDNCDVTGKRSFADLCRALALALCRDGEFLLREVRGSSAGEFGYQLQVLDVSRLDTQHNRAASPGVNAIRMGVEIDSVGKPVAYHILTSQPGYDGQQRRERERVPADGIIHGFIPLEDEDTRGVPWLHAAMRRLNDLGGYREAAVIAARVGAAKMGIWETPDGGPPPGHDGDATTPDAYVTDATPGHFDFAPTGYKLHTYDPAYPHEQFDAFCKATLRGIASGAGVAYNSLANDLEGVNFSTIRAGVLEERDEWMVIQNWMITAVLVRVFEHWLEAALMKGAVTFPSGAALSPAKLSKYREHLWQGRRWAWVDPLRDIQASALAIDRCLASPQQIAAQTGRDVEEVLDDIALFEEMLRARGLQQPRAGTSKPTADAKPEPDDE